MLLTPLLVWTRPASAALKPQNRLVILSGSLNAGGLAMFRMTPSELSSPICQRVAAVSVPAPLTRSTDSPNTSESDSFIAPDSFR